MAALMEFDERDIERLKYLLRAIRTVLYAEISPLIDGFAAKDWEEFLVFDSTRT